MKRAALKRSRKPIPYRSAKTKEIYERPGGRRELVARLLEERPRCEAWIPRVCTGNSTDLHEKLRRSAGGNILDEKGILCVCRPCHDWIGRHPRASEHLGLSQRRWPFENLQEAGRAFAHGALYEMC